MSMGQSIRIVMVDDDSADAYTTQRGFARQKAPVDFVHIESGQDFIDRIDDDDVSADLVLLDINMPGMDGFEVLRRVRARVDFQQMPVIILSTSRSDREVRRAYQMGANAFISKPQSTAEMDLLISGFSAYWFDIVRLPGIRRPS